MISSADRFCCFFLNIYFFQELYYSYYFIIIISVITVISPWLYAIKISKCIFTHKLKPCFKRSLFPKIYEIMDACFHHSIIFFKKGIVIFFLFISHNSYFTLAILRRNVRIDRKKWASIIKWLDGENRTSCALSELKEKASCALFFCLGLVQESPH